MDVQFKHFPSVLFALCASSLLVVTACSKEKPQGPPPVAPQDVLILELMGPPDGSDPSTGVCADPIDGDAPQGWVVEVTAPFELDSARDGQGGFNDTTLTMVFNDAFQRQCATGDCGRPWVPNIFESPVKVRVEGTRQDEDSVGDDTQNFDVLCRGETFIFPRDFTTTDCFNNEAACNTAMNGTVAGAAKLRIEGGYAPQGAEQVAIYRQVFNARVRMLGVGRSNELFSEDPSLAGETLPWLVHASATGFIDGRVLIAGGGLTPGIAENNAYVFDPDALQITSVLGMLGGRRAAHTAVRVSVGPAQVERVWLIGGVNELDAGLDSVVPALDTSLFFNTAGVDFVAGPLLLDPRAKPAVQKFQYDGGGGLFDRVLVGGGYTTASLTAFGVGEGTSEAAAIWSAETDGVVATTSGTAGRAGGHVVVKPDNLSAMVVGGYSTTAPGDAVNCPAYTDPPRLVDCSDVLDIATDTFNAVETTPIVAHGSATDVALTSDPAVLGVFFAGGISDRDAVNGETATNATFFYTTQVLTPGLVLPEARARHTAEVVADGRVILIGGGRRDVAGLFTDISADSAVYSAPGFNPGGGNVGAFVCDNLLTDTVLPDCPQLLAPRVGHASTVVEGTHWFAGSVMIVGGASGAFVAAGGPDTATDPAAELFVPAFTCDEVDDGNGGFTNQPPPALGGGLTSRCENNRRFNNDNDIYRNGPDVPQ